MRIGIDATNLRQGGGRTHLIELLRAAEPEKQGIDRVVVWGSKETLGLLVDRPWLDKVSPPEQDGGLVKRTLWQRFKLSDALRDAGCDILFVPGGSYAGDFHPVVSMSQNMLPFEWDELKRFGFSKTTLRYFLLRTIQSRSMYKADGMIFLTEYAKQQTLAVTGDLVGISDIVPHGLSHRFFIQPRQQRSIEDYSDVNPFRLLYVSIINQYKHQWYVVEAVSKLRQQYGWPLVLDLVGPAYPPALKRLDKIIALCDPKREWVHYHGTIAYDELHNMYAQADLGVFASSCENLPIILLETMAAGLPVACSNRGPMPEVLGDSGVYFDPEKPQSISDSLRPLIESTELRVRLAESSYTKAKTFSWQRCAHDTFRFLVEVCNQQKNQKSI